MPKMKRGIPQDTVLQILLIGHGDEDFFVIRDLLNRGDAATRAKLDHATSYEEAARRIGEKRYDLILFGYEAQDGIVLRLLPELRRLHTSVPFIFLAEYADENTLAEIIAAGACDFVKKSELCEDYLGRSIRYAINLQRKDLERHQAEGMLGKLFQAVQQSADLVMITDQAGLIEYVNPAFEELTGYSRDDVIGSTPALLKSAEQSPEIYGELWTTVLSGKVFRGTLANCKKNGEIFYLEKTITPISDAEGNITHFICNDRDITGRRKLEAQLRQAQKMDAIGQLAGGIAHDFNNLLMIISSYAELALDSIDSDNHLRHNVEEIQKAAHRAAELTRKLLAFSRKQMQVLQVLDLNPVIIDMGEMLPRLIGEHIDLMVIPRDDLWKIKADPVQIQQILMNLATNARDAMPDGGNFAIETANVRVDEAYIQRHSMVPLGEYVLLTVSDSGQGIDSKDLSHIFEPFFTTKEKGKGTGLGLATVYGIVKQNGGFIWVYSEPGMGTIFKIYLPRVHEKQDAPKVALSDPGIHLKGSETVLLVEDEPAVREATAKFLRIAGYKVLEARDGEHAIEVADGYSGPIQIAVTDVVMPRMSGVELAEHLAIIRRETKVLFVSGYAERSILQRGATRQRALFLQKPFGLKVLVQKIQQVLKTKVRQSPTEATAVPAISVAPV